MKKLFGAIAVAALAIAASVFVSPAPVSAQSSGSVQAQTPLTRDLGSIRTLTAATAATYVSADQSGFNVSRITCVLNQSAKVGSPSTVFKLQNKDAISGKYYDLITSSATTANDTPNPISAGAGVVTTANVGAGVPIARTWRVSATVSSTTSMTGTIGCSVQ